MFPYLRRCTCSNKPYVPATFTRSTTTKPESEHLGAESGTCGERAELVRAIVRKRVKRADRSAILIRRLVRVDGDHFVVSCDNREDIPARTANMVA
uniref:Transposase n=1 Tax=Steinernema glaseri TaxID=37863 RepID=A0A1I7Y414_9BILA